MHFIDPAAHTRRAFLRRSGQLAMTGTALPFALNLASMGEAAAQAASGDDYKALVCVFLFGGNDYANTVVTYDDPSYTAYSTIRVPQASGGVAIAKADLAPTLLVPDTALADGRQYALHPAMTKLAALFNTDKKVAVQLNVGPLVVPLTRATFNNSNKKLYPVPPKLFSHNDQQSTWQSSSPEGSTVGWGGNIGDLALTQNSNSLFTCMSVAGNAVFLSGDTALQYQVSTGGAVGIASVKNANTFGSTALKNAMAQLVQETRGHALENEYNRVTKRAVEAESSVTAAIQPATFATDTFVGLNTGLANQLKMVARIIRGRSTLGAKRQVFFVSMGGFDLHDKLIANQAGLMGQLSDALTAFHQQMVAQGMADKVTAFTASDFGRTLASNGDGSDHGWGSHHFIVGGAVKGKQLYGTPQVVSINNDSKLPGYEGHVGQGRLIPTTSVDQYGATLAKWFGVPDAQLPSILPNLRNFGGSSGGIAYPINMGFMT
ncbi:conserved hypothetical protein [Burkholderiales bacterium 8X]|nr:conserved hypothetical protein [Burkholderiales bacterium 8X]